MLSLPLILALRLSTGAVQPNKVFITLEAPSLDAPTTQAFEEVLASAVQRDPAFAPVLESVVGPGAGTGCVTPEEVLTERCALPRATARWSAPREAPRPRR